MEEIFISISGNPFGFIALLVFAVSAAMIVNQKDFFPVAEGAMIVSSLAFFIFPFSFWGGCWIVCFIVVCLEALFLTGIFSAVLCGCLMLKGKVTKKTED